MIIGPAQIGFSTIQSFSFGMVLFFPEWEWVGWGKEFEEGGRAGRGEGPEPPPPLVASAVLSVAWRSVGAKRSVSRIS